MESDGPSPKRIRGETVGGEEDGRLRRDDGHEDGGLIDLPTEILHSVMLHVSEDLRDHFNAVAAIRTLRLVADDEVFLRDIDLFTLEYPPLNDDRSIMNFLIACSHRGNISAMFLRGCSEFFYRNDMENGLSMIRQSASSGYELGVYVYANLRRILTPNEEIDLEMISPNRDLVRRMRRRIEESSHYYWGPQEIPQLYVVRCASYDSSIIRRCQCAWCRPWGPLYEESVKDPWMCDTCFYAIHVLGFIHHIPHRVMEWPMQ